MSSFKIDFDIRSCVGKVYNISKTHKGNLLVEALSKDQVPKLKELTKLCDYEVVVVPHGQLNTFRGVVSCKDLVNCTINTTV